MPTLTDTRNPRLSEQVITHGSCGRSWTGPGRCHCSAAGCHRVFNSLTAFDEHQAGGSCSRGRLVCKQGLLGEVIWLTGFKGSSGSFFGVEWLPDSVARELMGTPEYRVATAAARDAFAAAMDAVWARDGLGLLVPVQRSAGAAS